MFEVKIRNHFKRAYEIHYARKVETRPAPWQSGRNEVWLYKGHFNRDDSAETVQTEHPILIRKMGELEKPR